MSQSNIFKFRPKVLIYVSVTRPKWITSMINGFTWQSHIDEILAVATIALLDE